MTARPSNADSRCCRQSCRSPSGCAYWFAGNGVFTRRFVFVLLCLLIAGTAGARHPLEPLDTSSPRATLESFLTVTEEVEQRYSEYRESPSPATEDALLQMRDRYRQLLDLSEVPPAAQGEVNVETFVLLWEVIARLKLPDLEEIPDAPAKQEGDAEAESLTRWQLPNTEIIIARVDEGPRAGQFLFSPETVARARLFYERVHELPYQRPIAIGNVLRIVQLHTGWMIPLAWVEALPGWANTPVFGQVLWKWFALALLFGLALGAVIAVFFWARRRSWDGSLRSYLRRLITPLAILILTPPLHFFITYQINVTGSAAQVPGYLIEVANGVALVWIVWLTASWIAVTMITLLSKVSSRSLDAHLIRLAARTVGILAILVLMFHIANNVGIPVYGLVAGAGVSGLAIALAARSTLENFLGTLNLYADRPVRVGDFCRYGEDSSSSWLRIGTVEEIGLRSTRIRGLDRTITTIPNAEFSNMHVVNLTKRDRMLLKTNIGLRYETTPDQLRLVLAELREMLLAHPRISEDPARVRAIGFGASSLDLEIFAYVNTRDWEDFLAVQEDVVLRIMDIVRKAGTAFAFPSRTVYHTRDDGLDSERQQAAEKQVREWAAAQILPFPDFPYDYRKQVVDTLDYPPDGSPKADRG